MATYIEINDILTYTVSGAQTLRDKVGVACLKAASIIVTSGDTSDPPWDQTAGAHDQRVKWVHRLITNYNSTMEEVFRLVIAANTAATQAQILDADEATIDSSVQNMIDALASNLV